MGRMTKKEKDILRKFFSKYSNNVEFDGDKDYCISNDLYSKVDSVETVQPQLSVQINKK